MHLKKNTKGIYELTQPQADWRPVFDRVDNKETGVALEVVEGQQKQESVDELKEKEGKLSVSVIPNASEAANPSNLISISIGVKYGEAGPSTNLNFAFDPDYPQDLII